VLDISELWLIHKSKENPCWNKWLETGLRTAWLADVRGIIETMLAAPKLPVADSQKRPGEKH